MYVPLPRVSWTGIKSGASETIYTVTETYTRKRFLGLLFKAARIGTRAQMSHISETDKDQANDCPHTLH